MAKSAPALLCPPPPLHTLLQGTGILPACTQLEMSLGQQAAGTKETFFLQVGEVAQKPLLVRKNRSEAIHV